MATITEDYVSFETAKLLKEKGFDESIRCWYDNFQGFHEEGVRMCNTDCLPPIIMCPTLQMAMKWLREVHNIKIMIRPYVDGTYSYEILNGFWYVNFDSYEDAAEAAIKYCLENLIK